MHAVLLHGPGGAPGRRRGQQVPLLLVLAALALLLTGAAGAAARRGDAPRLARVATDTHGAALRTAAVAPGGARLQLVGAPEAGLASAAPSGARLRLGRLDAFASGRAGLLIR